MAVATPHFSFPFAFSSEGASDSTDPTVEFERSANVVEQGTPAEIEACVEYIVSCNLGDCPDLPTLGIPDPMFANAPLDASAILRAINLWEPRAKVTVTDIADPTDPSHRFIEIEVT